MTPYGDTDLGQYCFGLVLGECCPTIDGVLWHSYASNSMESVQDINPQNEFEKITFFELSSHRSGAIELTIRQKTHCPSVKYVIVTLYIRIIIIKFCTR